MKNVIAKGNHVTMRSAEMECVVRVLYLEVLCFFTESAGIIRVSIVAGGILGRLNFVNRNSGYH